MQYLAIRLFVIGIAIPGWRVDDLMVLSLREVSSVE